ncbi:FtsH protease activity modulator HflK [Emcibacteraceae bacterium]|nr:FtsH protease activity modulator HflK [Emcibacteraceae bacterium]MDA9553784.1 FtsH protease activity modulator HflK [Emcibacteraceae bacterium]
MSWQNNGGDRGPWGQGPKKVGGGGDGPPDIDELIRKGQDKFKNAFGGGGSGGSGESIGGGKGFSLILLGLAVFWLYNCFYIVNAGEEAVVLRFGKLVEKTMPGIHFQFYPVDNVEITNVQEERTIQIGFANTAIGHKERQMLTGDENIVDAQFTVFWRIKDVADYQFNLNDPQLSVKSIAESAMRAVVAKTEVERVMTSNKDGIEIEVREISQGILDDYKAGIQITSVKLDDVRPPEELSDAFDDVQKATADRDRSISLAELEQNKIVPQARGQAAKMLQQAEAYRSKVIAEAEGEASRFEAILTEYSKAKDVTRRRIYLDTMQQVLSGTNKIVIDGDGGSGVVPYLPLNELQKNRPSSNNNPSGQ